VGARDSSLAHPPRLRRLIVALLLVLAVCIAGLVLALRELNRPAAVSNLPPLTGPDATWTAGAVRAPAFTLADERGRPFTLSGYRGRQVIVTFIDPLCRDFCPLEAQRLNALVDELPAGARPAIVAVSTNVYGNARANLLLDRRRWRLVPEWRWGIAAPQALAAVWRSYHVQVLASKKTIAGVTVHRITHTEAAYLVDRSGHERALFLWPFSSDEVLKALKKMD
jgi:cytochrome oxidase Cu insertion factor (SCO1/SenC/PrrC family)